MKLFRVHLYFIAADLLVSRSRKIARVACYCVIAKNDSEAIRLTWDAHLAMPSWREAVYNPHILHDAFECRSGIAAI